MCVTMGKYREPKRAPGNGRQTLFARSATRAVRAYDSRDPRRDDRARGKKTHANARHAAMRTGIVWTSVSFVEEKKNPCFRGSRSVSPELVRFAMIVLSISHSGGVPYTVRKHVPTPDLTTLYLITVRRRLHSEDRDKQRATLHDRAGNASSAFSS